MNSRCAREKLRKEFRKKKNLGNHYLGCRKWGFKRWGFKEIRGYLRKRPFSSVFWIFQVLLSPSGKGRKRQKKGEKGRFPPISGRGGQTLLKPPFVTPPFVAAQITPQNCLWNYYVIHPVGMVSVDLAAIQCDLLGRGLPWRV